MESFVCRILTSYQLQIQLNDTNTDILQSCSVDHFLTMKDFDINLILFEGNIMTRVSLGSEDENFLSYWIILETS